MTNEKTIAEQNKQSTIEPESKSGGGTSHPKAKSGKDAASHTKAGSDKGAGGGKKQQRNH
jgi:hypothetical protein